MGFREQFYPQTVAAMIQRNGESRPDSSGNRLPITPAIQTIGILGTLAPHIIRVIEAYQRKVGTDVGAMRVSFLDGNGALSRSRIADSLFGPGAGQKPADKVSISEYLAGVPFPSEFAHRAKSISGKTDVTAQNLTYLAGATYYAPYYDPSLISSVFDEEAFLGFIRDMVREWQQSVNVSANCLAILANANTALTPEQNAAFWSGIRRLCSSIDVCDENPPQEFFDRVKEAVSYSMDKTAEFAGEAAAAIAEKAGDIAGNAIGGFFKGAGITAIAVAGIAVWYFTK